MRFRRGEKEALREAVRDLYGFVREMDLDPEPVASYVCREDARRAATRAVGNENLRRSAGPEPDVEDVVTDVG